MSQPSATEARRSQYRSAHSAAGRTAATAQDLRDATRRRARDRASSARSAIVAQSRLQRQEATEAELSNLVASYWAEFEASVTPDEWAAFDVDHVADLEAAFLRECAAADFEPPHLSLSLSLDPDDDHMGGNPENGLTLPWKVAEATAIDPPDTTCLPTAMPCTPPPPSTARSRHRYEKRMVPGWCSSPLSGPMTPSSPMLAASPFESCVLCGTQAAMAQFPTSLRCSACAVEVLTPMPYAHVAAVIQGAEAVHANLCSVPYLLRGYHADEGLIVHCNECGFMDVLL
ncbi:hypothetical protein BC828DRAFT_383883 [Blastocladiella britannica]|nr:hypothetical protein BC828DRAFT_383883 [Blastocladiella britannica]